jgi:hypothetical protein
MCFTTQDSAGAGSDVAGDGGDLERLERLRKWVSHLTPQAALRIANRWEAKYAPPSSRDRGNDAWLAQAAQ